MVVDSRVDTDEPVTPNVSLGGFRLRTPLLELKELLFAFYVKNLAEKPDWYDLVDLYEARYDLVPIAVCADVRNGKIFKLIAQRGYEGKPFGKLHVGMNAGEAMALEPRLYYDEAWEGLYVKGCPGVTLDVPEEDPYPHEVPSYPIWAISVYAEEAFTPEGQGGRR